MSNRNDENAAMGVAVAAIGMAALLMFAFLAFVALIATIVALFAWNRPRRLGPISFEPAEARRFVGRGLLGALLVPAFATFCAALFDLRIDWDFWWSYLLIGGYTAGSVGLEILMEDDDELNVETSAVSTASLPAEPQRAMGTREDRPFRFARWDDGEKDA